MTQTKQKLKKSKVVKSPKSTKQVKNAKSDKQVKHVIPVKLLQNIKNRIKKMSVNHKVKVNQKGGDITDITPSSDGSFDNLINQLIGVISQGIESIGSGVETAYSVMTLPADLAWDLERPNEPIPGNTLIPKLPI